MKIIGVEKIFTGKYGNECTICTDTIEFESDARVLRCNHSFHKDCLFEWLKEKHSCPMCRCGGFRNESFWCRPEEQSYIKRYPTSPTYYQNEKMYKKALVRANIEFDGKLDLLRARIKIEAVCRERCERLDLYEELENVLNKKYDRISELYIEQKNRRASLNTVINKSKIIRNQDFYIRGLSAQTFRLFLNKYPRGEINGDTSLYEEFKSVVYKGVFITQESIDMRKDILHRVSLTL